MRDLVAEGVQSYDLGTEMDYKRRWADSTFETTSLFLMR
jgi:hypothetical protein